MDLDIDFEDNIKALQEELERARAELAALEAQRESYDVRTQECRDALNDLRAAGLEGKLPAAAKPRGGKIKKLEVNEETGRPPRGARRRQIEAICKQLGRGNASFRSIHVVQELEAIEGDLNDGMKSYTYAVLNTLHDQGTLEKLKRGTWKLS